MKQILTILAHSEIVLTDSTKTTNVYFSTWERKCSLSSRIFLFSGARDGDLSSRSVNRNRCPREGHPILRYSTRVVPGQAARIFSWDGQKKGTPKIT